MLSEALHTYLQVDRSPQTNKQYGVVLNQLVTAIGPQRDVALVRYEDLVDYFARLRQRGVQQSTLSGYLSVTKSFFRWCAQHRYIDQSPADQLRVRRPRRSSQQARAVPPEELSAMVDYARLTSPRNYALLLFLVDTGCRVGGLSSLTLERLHLESGWALLLEKGQNEHRALYGEETAAALARWLQKRPAVSHRYLWTGQGPDYNPLTRGGIAAIIRRIATATGASRAWGPHAIRHAVGHAYAKAGVPVTVTQRKLGHHSPTVTMAYYYPDDDAYLEQISRRNALVALRSEEPAEEPPAPRLVKLKNGS